MKVGLPAFSKMSSRVAPQIQDSDDDDDDAYEVYECTPESRKAGKTCISLTDCRYDIGLFTDYL